jgi:hypothetical protein
MTNKKFDEFSDLEQDETAEKIAADADDTDDETDAGEGEPADERKPKLKQADILMGIANAAALFHTPAPDSDAFAEITIGGHRETLRVTDPRAPEQRSPPTNEEDLLVAAKTAHVLPYDNFSHLPDWLSDAFCRLATGGGAGKRKLYTDDDEILFEGRRPILLTGIEDFVTRPDLVDRANFFNHEIVKDKDRLSDQEIEARFQRDKAKIFGALLDGVAAALKNLPSVELSERPRMADFAMWAEAGTRLLESRHFHHSTPRESDGGDRSRA